MRVTVIEDLIYGVESNLIIAPDLLAERLLGDNRRRGVTLTCYICADIIVRTIFGVLREIQRETKTSTWTIRELHKDALRVIAHIMTHIVGIRGEL